MVITKQYLLMVALVGVCWPVSLCAQSSVQHPSGEPAQAERALENARQMVPELSLDPSRRHELQQALQSKDYKRAETILVEESEHDPGTPRAAQLLVAAAGIFFLDGQYLNSVIAWKRAEAITPLDTRSRFTLAMAYVRLNRRDWARPELERLVTAHPEEPLYLFWLARLDYDGQSYQSAIAKLQNVIALNSEMVRAYDLLGLCYDYVGQTEDAIQNYHRAVELNRRQTVPSAWPHVDLATTLIEVNQWTQAEQQLREALRYNAQLPQAHYQLGRLLEMQGEYDASAQALQKALALDPAYPEPHLILARIYHRLGKAQQADTEVKQFQQLKTAAEGTAATKPPQ